MTTVTAAVQAVPPRFEALRRFGRAFAGSKSGIAGLAVLIAVTVLALRRAAVHPPERPECGRRDRAVARRAERALPARHRPGRPVGAALLIWGTRPSLAIGVIATLLTMVLGSAIGLRRRPL